MKVNYAYYLLAQGMDGAIGLRDSEKIFYRALTTHLVSNSRFIDARLACVASAEEIFGQGTTQATETGSAFDAVEIFDGRGTPPPSPFPPVNGQDALLFLFFDNATQSYFLGRREHGLGDADAGVQLADNSVAPARASVAGDGSFAAFVNDQNDICFINTDGTKTNPNLSTVEDCLGFPGFISSVAVAPDGQRFGFVLLDAHGKPDNKIRVIDGGGGARTQTFTLQAPALDGGLTDTVLNGDVMNFTSDGRSLIYDALNQLQLSDGSQVLAWSIYALDIDAGVTQTLVPPTRGFDIDNPALSHTRDNFITFDATDQQTGQTTVFAANLTTGQRRAVASIADGLGVPGYAGDDTAIVYSQADNATATGFSLMRQPLGSDHITPSGAATVLLANADFGVTYRRGAFNGPGACVGDCNGDHSVTVDEILAMVNIALGNTPLSDCQAGDANHDNHVTVDEILTAVNAALSGCP
ncbi:MAG: M4 family metallopeptidase [Candidatus Binatia bacterium]